MPVKKASKSKAKMKKKDDISSFDFSQSSDYKLYAANGAWGGITPRGDFMIEFFIEKSSRPESVKYRVKDKKSLGDEISRKFSGEEFTREMQCGIIVTLNQAEILANWILQNLQALKANYPEIS